MNVAEGRGQQVAAVLAEPKHLNRAQRVFGGRVELVVDLVGDAVFFAADDADLDLHEDVRLRTAGEQLARDLQVLL